ncbi:MAG: hypothetical protein J4G16_02390 [Acidobacteria bacterium]|nr:hypothetical protein [Acidobacteriota bacterium]MCY4636232.1 hypothetical protein [Acidobacteriota bacterium]
MGIATLVVVVLTVAGVAPATAQGAGPAGAERADADPLTAQIQVLEHVLSRAVALSARGVEQQMPPWTPGLMLFAGPAQVRGFRLAGYGVFFDVECPVLRQSVLWSLEMMDADLRRIRGALQELRLSGALPPVLRELEPNAGRRVAFTPGGAAAPADRPGLAAPGDAPAPGGGNAPEAAAPDLHTVYQEALREMLVDALLGYGGRLGALLDGNDWLTVVARDTRGLPGRDTTVRVRAGDVAALHAGGLTLDEVRARVDVSSF